MHCGSVWVELSEGSASVDIMAECSAPTHGQSQYSLHDGAPPTQVVGT